jgi:peptidoglycan/LPS O-acetylase OafA/YrhL
VADAARTLRPEIQALRALAVALVVVYHLWPAALPGGFVGVDVFFVISGFLITSLLLREVDARGTVSLSGFWARRARRILPAALLTLLFCALATALVVPRVYWQQFFGDIRASTAYVQNWHLASAAVDYMAADNAPSAVQHFWSLSVEEQFYVVWPVVILLARRRAAALATLTAASLAYSIYATAANPAAAYFVTPTRAWEFGAGGLLAMAPALRHGRAALSWAGLAAIGVAAGTYGASTPFPGYTALLPVAGALAIIAAARPSWPLTIAPVQFLGDISYSVYLWHWPLIVLAPFAFGHVPRLGIVAATLLVAWGTKLLVEDPVRASRFLLAHRPRLTLSFAVAATVAVIVVAETGVTYVRGEARAAERREQKLLASKPTCLGAAARDPVRPCSNPRLRTVVVPAPIEAARTPNAWCERVSALDCRFGVPHPRGQFAVIGDSHAQHWRAALQVVARARRWRGHSITRSGCELSLAPKPLPEPARSQCIAWNKAVPRWLANHPAVHTVYVAEKVPAAGELSFAAAERGYAAAWRALPASVTRIVVIRDTPEVLPGGETLACVDRAMSAHRDAARACAVPRAKALAPDPAAAAARRMRSKRVRVLDLTRFFCDRRRCYPVIGGVLVYKDMHHLTKAYARTLGPYLLSSDDRAARAGARAARARSR